MRLRRFKPRVAGMDVSAPMEVASREEVARLLFYRQMINEKGEIQNAAFPMDDIVQENGRSLSVDRCGLLGKSPHRLLERKADKFAKAGSNRSKHGYCLAIAGQVRSLQGQDNEQLFEIVPDPVAQPNPAPWDRAHAKLVSADPSSRKAYLRGYRDKLIAVFSNNVRLF